LESCNNYIKSSNEGIDKRIREIISRPVFSRLTDEQTSSIYRILKIGLSQAITSQKELLSVIKEWDFASKVNSYGFTTEFEGNNAKNILASIQQDQTILSVIKEVRDKITDLERLASIIKIQSNEISSRIDSHHYKVRRRCCPPLIRDVA
jgi:hypothetical protein